MYYIMLIESNLMCKRVDTPDEAQTQNLGIVLLAMFYKQLTKLQTLFRHTEESRVKIYQCATT